MRNGTPHAFSFSTVASSPSSVASTSGRTTTSQPHERAADDIAAVDAQHQFRAGGDRRLDLARIEAVDGNAQPGVAQGPHRVADAAPGRAGIAAQVDDVGAVGAQRLGLSHRMSARLQARRVVDLGENGDVVGAVIAAPSDGGHAEDSPAGRADRRDRARPTAASARSGSRSPWHRPGRMTRSMPGGTVRCRAIHGVVARATTVIGSTATLKSKPARRQIVQHAAQRRLGQLAGHEQQVRTFEHQENHHELHEAHE